MTRREMMKIFSLMMLAWPNAPMFKVAPEKLDMTINLWRLALNDVDFITAKQAMILVCRTCKFPPSIADLKEAAEQVNREIQEHILLAFHEMRNTILCCDNDVNLAYRRFSPDIRLCIDLMGGTKRLFIERGGISYYDVAGFEAAYRSVLCDEAKDKFRLLDENLEGKKGKELIWQTREDTE